MPIIETGPIIGTDPSFESFERGAKLVYLRPVAVSSLPAEVQDQAEGRAVLYALHDASGAQIALAGDADMAIAFARAHDFAPVHLT